MSNAINYKWKKEISLLDQIFDDDNKLNMAKCLKAKADELGGTIQINSFTTYALGEGMEKKKDNFADEVAAMTQQ